MAELTNDQLRFLRSQRIPLSSVYDASGMKKTDYQLAMRAEGKSFAYGVTPCGAGRHTLRTRAGHCIQCDHSKIAYMLRHDAKGFIYIAASTAGRLIKIGCTSDIADRSDKLNRYQYGGQKDWQILATAHSPSAGRVESDAQAALSAFAVPGEYAPAGRRQRCYELFRCDFADARDALKAALGKGGVIRVPDPDRALTAFRFR